jgi:hypothetical protein
VPPVDWQGDAAVATEKISMHQHRFVHRIRYRPCLTLLSIALFSLGLAMQALGHRSSVAVLLGGAVVASIVMAGLLGDVTRKLYLRIGDPISSNDDVPEA